MYIYIYIYKCHTKTSPGDGAVLPGRLHPPDAQSRGGRGGAAGPADRSQRRADGARDAHQSEAHAAEADATGDESESDVCDVRRHFSMNRLIWFIKFLHVSPFSPSARHVVIRVQWSATECNDMTASNFMATGGGRACCTS